MRSESVIVEIEANGRSHQLEIFKDNLPYLECKQVLGGVDEGVDVPFWFTPEDIAAIRQALKADKPKAGA